MIPKVIHYCWFSNEPKPKNVKACLKSWKKKLPGYRVKCWDMSSFDFDSVSFTKEALAARKWAFVSDYIRLYALYTEGGIYLDSDVQAFDTLDKWLKYDLFTGIEKRGDTDELFIEAAIIGASKGNPVIGKCLEIYNSRNFLLKDGTYDLTPIPSIVTPLFCKELGWKQEDKTAEITGNSIVLSSNLIANTESEIKPSVVLYHWNNRSWIERNFKEKLYKFVKDIGLLPLWNKLNNTDQKASGDKQLHFSGPVILKRQFEAEVYASHTFCDELSDTVVNNGIIVPEGLPSYWGKNGGVLDESLNYVDASAFHEGIKGGEIDKSHYQGKSVSEYNIDCIYLGQICNVWGHVFTDDLKRIWFFDTQRGKNLISLGFKVVYTTMNNQPLPQYVIDVFKIAGFDINSCERISSPTRFRSIVIPDSSIKKIRERNIGVRLFHPLFIDCIRTICNYVDKLDYPEIICDKVYLTLSKFTGSHKDFNESELENYYSKLGYSIVSPESMKVDQQIYLIRKANTIVTTDGSIGHMSIFCNPTTKIKILLKANYVNPYQTCISDVFDLDVSYVCAHHSLLANKKHPNNGPFYLCVTKYLEPNAIPVLFKTSFWKYLILNFPLFLKIKRVISDTIR